VVINKFFNISTFYFKQQCPISILQLDTVNHVPDELTVPQDVYIYIPEMWLDVVVLTELGAAVTVVKFVALVVVFVEATTGAEVGTDVVLLAAKYVIETHHAAFHNAVFTTLPSISYHRIISRV
jgi:hypothetical protein